MKQINQDSRATRERRISQKLTTSSKDLRNITTSRSPIFKLLAVVLSLVLCVLSSSIAGLLGGYLGFNIVLPYKDTLFLMICLTLAVSFWLIICINQNLLRGTVGTFIGILLLSLFAGLVKPDLGINVLLISLLGLGVGAFTIFSECLSLHLVNVLFDKGHQIYRVIICCITSTVAVLTASAALSGRVLDNTGSKGLLLLPDNIRNPVVLCSFLFGLGFLSSSLIITNFTDKRKEGFTFLYDWAVIVVSWGGISFYNLDLSEFDFSGSKLTNSDFRARNFYRTCLREVTGLEKARVDNRYLDLENPNVRRLLTNGDSENKNFYRLNLRGAYLQEANMQRFDLTETNLTGADLQKADLRDSILVRTQLAEVDLRQVDLRSCNLTDANLTGADSRKVDVRNALLIRTQVAQVNFTGADLTGICIEDWSVSSKTRFTDVRCDYIYRKYQDGQPTERYPVDRDFEPGEFAALFQQPENELELVFKGEFDYTALSLTFDKLQADKPDLNLKLQGIEQRGNLWVVKITSDDPAGVKNRIKEIQDAFYQGYEVSTSRLEKNPLIRSIISDVANIRKTQEETVEEVKQLAKRLGSNFYFLGGTITNVTGAGEINYAEASNQIRSLVASGGHETQVANTLLTQLRSSNVATTANEQTELIQFVILEEAQRDPRFKQFLLQQEQQILSALPESSIATAIQAAIAQLTSS